MKHCDNLLLIAGTGRNSGKTSLACALLSRFKSLKPIAIKISPHFHKASDGLKLLYSESGFKIFIENSLQADKDSSRMLSAGASVAYYIQASSSNNLEAFTWLGNHINADSPIICESPALRPYVVPGIFLIADSQEITIKKPRNNYMGYKQTIVRLGTAEEMVKSLEFSDKGWRYTI